MAYADIMDIGQRRQRSEPSPELTADQKRLDIILRHTRFNHTTKALWSYYRGNESTKRYAGRRGNKAIWFIRINRILNGSRYHRDSLQPETIANWDHAIRLIDIARTRREIAAFKPFRLQ